MRTINFSRNPAAWLHGLATSMLLAFVAWYFLFNKPEPDYNELLSGLASALVTIAATLFSAVLVALALASAQFSPRVVRQFFRESSFNQGVFYAFLFGIAFCFAVKFTYSKSTGTFEYPSMPIAAAVYCFFLITFILPRFVFHIADSINAATMARKIAERTLFEIDALYGTTIWQPEDACFWGMPPTSAGALPIKSIGFGFIDSIDYRKLGKIAREHPDLQIQLEVLCGNFVSEGEVLTTVVGNPTLPVENAIRACFSVSKYRSYHQDVLFGVRQLVDISIKAISPAINDPTTAVNCLHYLGIIVQKHAQSAAISLAASQAPPNLHIRDFSFEMLCDQAFDQIYQWGKGDYIVVAQILNTLSEIAANTQNPYCLEVLGNQVHDYEVEKLNFFSAEEKARVMRRLEGFWTVVKLKQSGNKGKV